MRADIQAQVTGPPPPVSNGQLDQDVLCVLAYLYLNKFANKVTQNVINMTSKVAAMRGMTPDNMLDLQIKGLTTQQGLTGLTWSQLLATARAAINGQGVNNPPTQAAITSGDYQVLINYAFLTAVGIINDAS